MTKNLYGDILCSNYEDVVINVEPCTADTIREACEYVKERMKKPRKPHKVPLGYFTGKQLKEAFGVGDGYVDNHTYVIYQEVWM